MSRFIVLNQRIAFVILTILFAFTEVQAFGFGLAPTRVEIALDTGSRSRQVITIKNVAKQGSIRLSLGLSDWTLNQKQGVVFSPLGTDKRSASSWVRFSPASMILGPGKSKQVLVDIYVPVKLPYVGDYRFALIASTILPPDKKGKNAGIWNKYQIASLFYCTIGNAKSKPVMSNLRIKSKKKSLILSYKLSNYGNAHARIKGEILILNQQNKPVYHQPVNKMLVLEGQVIRRKIKLTPKLRAGKYKLQLKLNDIYSPQEENPVPIKINSKMPVFYIR
jgi:hypothetical protein